MGRWAPRVLRSYMSYLSSREVPQTHPDSALACRSPNRILRRARRSIQTARRSRTPFLLPLRLQRDSLLASQKVEPSDTSDCYTVTILDIGHAPAGNLAGRSPLIRQFNISILTGEESTIIQGPQDPWSSLKILMGGRLEGFTLPSASQAAVSMTDLPSLKELPALS